MRYARNGDVRIAYRVIGSGDTTMVWTPGWISNLDLLDNPLNPFAALLQQLVDETRIVTFDKRGTGLSDPVTRIPPLDERMDDLHAVMDAAGLDSPVSLFGISEGGPMSILFAATFPERVRSLVLYGTAPRFTEQLPDWPWGHSPAKHQATRTILTPIGVKALWQICFSDRRWRTCRDSATCWATSSASAPAR